MTNSSQILETAKQLIRFYKIDLTKTNIPVRPLAREVATSTKCHITVAKRSVGEAIRIIRAERAKLK